jgi:hypothetical protein
LNIVPSPDKVIDPYKSVKVAENSILGHFVGLEVNQVVVSEV